MYVQSNMAQFGVTSILSRYAPGNLPSQLEIMSTEPNLLAKVCSRRIALFGKAMQSGAMH